MPHACSLIKDQLGATLLVSKRDLIVMQAYLEKTKYVFLVSKTLPEFSKGLSSPSCCAFENTSTWHDFHFLNYDTADREEK